MTFNRSTIFRDKAIERYRKQQYEAVFPRFLRPQTFRFVWLLLGLLFLSVALAWTAELPVYITAQAVMVIGEAGANEDQLVILIPAEAKSGVQAGQTVHILDEGIEVGKIRQVSPDVLSPAAATAVYNLPPGLITTPTIVATAPFKTTILSAAQYQGSLFTVHIEAGSQPLIANVPILGQFWGEPHE